MIQGFSVVCLEAAESSTVDHFQHLTGSVALSHLVEGACGDGDPIAEANASCGGYASGGNALLRRLGGLLRLLGGVVTAVHGALDDATEDAANDAAEEGLTGGGGLSGSGLGGVDDVEVGVLLSLEHGLSTGEAGEIKAGHVDGCFDDELTGLTREAVVIEGGGLSVAGDGEEGGTGEGSGGDASEALTEKSEGSHGRSV